jgi:hypothetical protein
MRGIKRVLVPSRQKVSDKKGPESVEHTQTKLKPVHVPMENTTIDSLGEHDGVFETYSLSFSASPSESKSHIGESRGAVYIPINKRDDNLQVMECPDRTSPLH